MRRTLLEVASVAVAIVMGYSAAQIPSPVASAQGKVCPTQPAIVCIAVSVTPGPSMTPTASATVVPSVTATASATPTATIGATATETLWPTPTQIVQGTIGPTQPIRFGLYSPYNQQRVRLCPAVDDINCPRVAWIGGGSTWAVWAERVTGINSMWLFIEDRARFISGWVAYKLSGIDYGTYVLDNH